MQIAPTKPDLAALLQPSVHHQTPEDVLHDADLDPAEKRAILASWASDMYAVESCPWLREIPGVHSTLRLSDILEALHQLGGNESTGPAHRAGHFRKSLRTRKQA